MYFRMGSHSKIISYSSITSHSKDQSIREKTTKYHGDINTGMCALSKLIMRVMSMITYSSPPFPSPSSLTPFHPLSLALFHPISSAVTPFHPPSPHFIPLHPMKFLIQINDEVLDRLKYHLRHELVLYAYALSLILEQYSKIVEKSVNNQRGKN